MGAHERKAKEKEIRRTDLIEAAERVIFAKGYEAATMDDIAREAEFSKRTVYVYFSSKEQLYFEIMVRGYDILLTMMEEVFRENEGNALDRLQHLGRTFYRFSEDYPPYFAAIMEYENGEMDFLNAIPDESREKCYALGEKAFSYVSETLKKGMEDGVLRGDLDITGTAIILWSCMLGMFTTVSRKRNYIVHYHKRDPEKLITDSFQLLLRSIEAGERNE
ncbi:TetR/AcrR family transcriptional regulator [Gorillibacterium massiliense]|uniref:TetR/AcrR family transcriptional regulator n=1 Tax=Gorillibacterium massiliense TaxID=1280390 RepID=UPI0004B59CFB|nr:TetR/AcrR family transcriptional regulator [Gorillibacterium massiliense]